MAQRIYLMLSFQTPLHNAIRCGNGFVVEILLRNGANINKIDVRMTLETQMIDNDRISERDKERGQIEGGADKEREK
jgi:hypothetical protein